MGDAAGLRIDVTGLGKVFRRRTVVSDLTLSVAPGEIVGLVGANGGGKTTTLRMLAGLLRPDGGSGEVLGRDVRKPERANRAKIGFMTQRLALYPELSVTQNLRFRAAIHRLSDVEASVAAAIEEYSLTPYAQTRLDRLSGGWARRAQFAATMLHAPELLLLDEPTAGLDATTRADIWGRLHALARAGHSIVIGTHDHAEARTCTRLMTYGGSL